MRIGSRTRVRRQPTRPAGGIALAALLSGAFVVTAGFGGPVKDAPSTSTASAETCALESVTPSALVVGLAAVHPTYAVTFSGCAATWSLGWPVTGASATEKDPVTTVDPARLTDAGAGRSTLYVTLHADDDTSTRTPVPVSLARRAVWGRFDAPVSARTGRPVTLRCVLGRADWDRGAYRGYAGARVAVLFRADGTRAFSKHSTVTTGKGGVLTVSAAAQESGTWRFEYAGSTTTGAAASGTNHVTVRPAGG